MCGIFFFRMIYEKIKLKPHETQPSIGRIVFRVARSYMQSLHIYRNQWTSATSMCPSPINEYEIVCESEAGGGGAERMIRVLCNACDTHIVWSLPTAQHRILLVLRTAAISELEQLYHYMYLLLCIVSPCKLTEWMSKYILCAVLCMLRHSAACAALYLYCIFLFCLPIVDLLLLLTVRADIRMCAP